MQRAKSIRVSTCAVRDIERSRASVWCLTVRSSKPGIKPSLQSTYLFMMEVKLSPLDESFVCIHSFNTFILSKEAKLTLEYRKAVQLLAMAALIHVQNRGSRSTSSLLSGETRRVRSCSGRLDCLQLTSLNIDRKKQIRFNFADGLDKMCVS